LFLFVLISSYYLILDVLYYAHWVNTLYNTPSGYSANFINLFIKYMIFIQKLTINYSCYYDLISLDNLDMRTKICNLQNPFWNFYLWERRYYIPFGVTLKL